MAAAAHVQIVTNSDERRANWVEALVAAGVMVTGQAGSDEGALEVVLTDLPLPAAEPGSEATEWQNGIVQVGESRPGEQSRPDGQPVSPLPQFDLDGPPRVVLPADASPREIVLACQLLAPIVRLRRVQRDASAREARWKQLADADPLTGLMNRRAFTEQLIEFLRLSGSSQNCCLALLDLDRFKPVNDEVGHSAGDALLQHVAERLTSAVRKGDLVCRLGGDEFAVALFGAPTDIAGRLVERLRQAITSEVAASGRPIAASAGWAMLATASLSGHPQQAGSELLTDAQVDQLYLQAFEIADANLRAAKAAGRNRTIPC